MLSLDFACHGKGIVIRITRHTDHQVDIGVVKHLIGFLCGRYLSERGWVAHTQLHIFVEDLLVDTAIILEHEGIVGIGYNQYVEDAFCHQVNKRHILQIELIPFLWYLAYFFHIRGQRYKKFCKKDGGFIENVYFCSRHQLY